MINLNEHIVEIEGKEYVPLSIAITAIEQASNLQAYQAKLDEAMKMMNDAFKGINNTVEELDD